MKELSLKMKRLFCLAVMALCILTPITAKAAVGNLSSTTKSKYGISITGNASYTYRLKKDEIYAYVALGGKNKNDATSASLTGLKITPNKKGAAYKLHVYKGKRSNSLSKKIDTKNSYITIDFSIGNEVVGTYKLYGK